MSEMVDDMIQSFGLFQSENENFKTTFSYEFLEYWNNKLSIALVTEVDCMEVYRITIMYLNFSTLDVK